MFRWLKRVRTAVRIQALQEDLERRLDEAQRVGAEVNKIGADTAALWEELRGERERQRVTAAELDTVARQLNERRDQLKRWAEDLVEADDLFEQSLPMLTEYRQRLDAAKAVAKESDETLEHTQAVEAASAKLRKLIDENLAEVRALLAGEQNAVAPAAASKKTRRPKASALKAALKDSE